MSIAVTQQRGETVQRTNQNLPFLKDSTRTSSTQFSSNTYQFGFIGGLGVQLPINKHFILFGEANILMLNMVPDKMKYLSLNEQGKEKTNPEDVQLKDETNTSDNNALRTNYKIKTTAKGRRKMGKKKKKKGQKKCNVWQCHSRPTKPR